MSVSPVMRAAVIERPRSASLQTAPVPVPGEAEVLIRLEGCGVCGSNLAVWQGQPWFEYPLMPGAPGHEGWGVVHAVGPGVSDLPVGTRVACLSFRAFAEYDLARADAVVPLPAALDGCPFPGEALACAFNVRRRSGVQPGMTVAIVGIGFLGATLTRLLAADGATVIAASRRPFALEVARAHGAAATVALDANDPAAAIAMLTGTGGCDVAIEAAGTQPALDVAAAVVRERGRLVVAGYHQDGPRQVDMQSWNWRGLDVINAHERDPRVYLDGLREAVAGFAASGWPVAPFMTHAVSLGDLAQALDLLERRPDGFLKALVTV